MWKDKLQSLFWFLLGLAIFLSGIPTLREDVKQLNNIKNSGTVTQATVVNRRKEIKLEEADSYYLTYSYRAINPDSGELEEFTQEQNVGNRIYANYAEGEEISIVYLPNDIESSWIIGKEPNAFIGILMLITGAIISIVAGYLLILLFVGGEASRQTDDESRGFS